MLSNEIPSRVVEHSSSVTDVAVLFGLLELPFLGIAIVFAFMTAASLKGGLFGKGMLYIALGFLVMAIGHIHMQVEHVYGFNLFNFLLGDSGGRIAWFVALIITWGLTGIGFYSLLKASRV